ncbi:hypothetical protein [Sphingomonas bacterium]|uniref:hypothetical protein n=1 Tax=Sphingomonas bacterium TaxID=1895847 RepID=UPI001575D766|nr:hypothetical protein [Sphingomonas bacterium]
MAYPSGLTGILDAKGPDPAADFAEAVSLAGSADRLLHAVAGDIPVVPGATDPQVATIKGFLEFVGDLQSEADKARQLRILVAQADLADTLIRSLRGQLAVWSLSRSGDAGLRMVIAGTLVRAAQASDLPPDRRRAFAATYYDRSEDTLQAARLQPALDAALAEVAAADADLRRVLRDRSNLSTAERAHLAHITRERVGRASDTLAAVISSFMGE